MNSDDIIFALIGIGIWFFISVVIARWVFRIDDIVAHLKSINEKLSAPDQQPIDKQDL